MNTFVEWAAYALIVLGALVLLAMLLGRWIRKIGPSTEEREALGSDICKDGVHPDECPSCRPLAPRGDAPGLRLTPAEFGAVMASLHTPPIIPGRPDVQWEADLARFHADYDTYRTELRLPGERAS